jgi:hypothetical protein
MQLELPFMATLPPEDKVAKCEYSVQELYVSYHRLRKGLWAENGVLRKRCKELEERLWIIERNICNS